MVERQEFSDPAYGVKSVFVTLVRKETKKGKEKNLSLLACPRMQAMAAAGLARLEGRGTGVGIMWWRGGGFRTRRKEGLCNIGQKRNEKKEKKKTYPYMRAHECRQWRRRDLRGLRGKARGWVLCGGEAGPGVWGRGSL